jgi:acyl carrier protein
VTRWWRRGSTATRASADKRITFAACRMMSHYDSILSHLYEILGPYTPDGHSLSEDTEFISDLGLDSMKVMQLLLDTEERFDISVPLNIIPDVRTVGHFARCLQQLVDRG